MTDTWFLQDIDNHLRRHNRMVILDPQSQCAFFLPLLEPKGYMIFSTDHSLNEEWEMVKEELFLRHQIETTPDDQPVVIYITREQNLLSFLFDYCFTYGCLDLSSPTDWLKKKLFATTGLQIQLDNPLLLTAAKLGMGKDIAWWKRILQNLQELISIDEELVPFLNDPEAYYSTMDSDILRLFEEKVFELLKQPYLAKPPKVLADEVVKALFNGLVSGHLPEPMLGLYNRWTDSEKYRPSLEQYISDYKVDPSAKPLNAHPDHCFVTLDLKALGILTANLRDKSFVSQQLVKIKERAYQGKGKRFVPSWWHDVITLLCFNNEPLSKCTGLPQLISFYTEQFNKVDRAIRNLYSSFLQDESIIRPLQEYYESLNREFLELWFEAVGDYKPDQQGCLPNLLKASKPGIAVIVGDGVRYEIANFICESLGKQYKVDQGIMLAGIPSETEHNMSALYTDDKLDLPFQKDRESILAAATGKNITFIKLEEYNSGLKADYLLLNYGDIDYAGEKLQQGAVKLFGEFEQVLKGKISLLLNSEYREVHLLTDHGFVLTGLLDPADKIEPGVTGKKEVHERFIRTVEKQDSKDLMGFENAHGEYNYAYVSKNHRPFKSKGVYGYSHGGLTPQEVILPKFTFRKVKAATPELEVSIFNRKELTEVTGELFGIKLQAGPSSGELFAMNRKVQVLLWAQGKKHSSSSIISMEAGNSQMLEFSFLGHAEVQAILVDATTQEHLDSVTIKKSSHRDLGGLM